MTKKQRDFLAAATNEKLPITFVDTTGTFSVYLSRLRFSDPHKDARHEERAELVMAEATGSVWSGPQVEFLRQCTDDILPLKLDWTDERRKLVYVTRVAWQTPYKGPLGAEPVLQLTMVESFHPREWMSYIEGVKIAETLTSISLYDGTVARYGTATYGYSGYVT